MTETRRITQDANPPCARASKPRRGFTILELLVVIAIMAMLATLTTGAVLKAMRQSRERRVEATVKALEMALVSYRAQENVWPFEMKDLKLDTLDYTDKNDKYKKYWAHGEANAAVFKKLYQNASQSGKTVYLDATAILTRKGSGSIMPLKNALNTDAPLGYRRPDDPNKFCYFCVCYNPLTDSVNVFRQDQQHWRTDSSGNQPSFWCPEGTGK